MKKYQSNNKKVIVKLLPSNVTTKQSLIKFDRASGKYY